MSACAVLLTCRSELFCTVPSYLVKPCRVGTCRLRLHALPHAGSFCARVNSSRGCIQHITMVYSAQTLGVSLCTEAWRESRVVSNWGLSPSAQCGSREECAQRTWASG